VSLTPLQVDLTHNAQLALVRELAGSNESRQFPVWA
jgi:hypothetical protein